jgi:hypothetical protein
LGQPGVLSDLPAIFARDLAEHGLQVEQGMLMRFGARKVGMQTLVKGVQLAQPATPLDFDSLLH